MTCKSYQIPVAVWFFLSIKSVLLYLARLESPAASIPDPELPSRADSAGARQAFFLILILILVSK
jgi:hypothetical protein